MSLIVNTIQHLLGGVSKQPAEFRHPHQCEDLVNWIPDPVRGLERRGAATHVVNIGTVAGTDFATVVKQGNLYYLLTVNNAGSVTVRGLDSGVSKTITDSLGLQAAYLPSASAKDSIEALSIGDSVLLLNKSVTTSTTATDFRTNHNYTTHEGTNGIGTIILTTGEPDTKYTVSLTDLDNSGVVIAGTTKTVSVTSPAANASIDYVMGALETAINGITWGATRVKKVIRAGNALVLLDASGMRFKIELGDTTGNHAAPDVFLAFNRDESIPIGDLPAKFVPGFYMKTTLGASSDTKTTLWMRSVEAGGTEITRGTVNVGSWASPAAAVAVKWIETNDPSAYEEWTASTQICSLKYYGDNDWRLERVLSGFGGRNVGDSTTNKTPSFLGRKIAGMAVYRNRLVLYSEGNACMSQAGTFTAFYRTSVATVLAEDRIDVSAAHQDRVDIKHAAVLNENLLLVSDKAQFLIRGGQVLTPESVSAVLSSAYEVNTDCKPHAVGRRVIFTTKSGSHSNVRAWVASSDRDIYELDELGGHIPGYLPVGVTKIISADSYGMTLMYAPGSTDIYVNSWVYNEREAKSLVNSFHRWSFKDAVLLAAIVENYVYLVSAGYIQKIDLRRASYVEAPGFPVHLDKRSLNSGGTYDAILDRTTFTTAYTLESGLTVVSAVTGEELSILTATGTSLVVEGNHTSVYFGYIQASEYTFSKFSVQRRDQYGGVVPQFGGRLQMKSVSVLFNGLGFLKGILTLPGRDPSVTAAYIQSGSVANQTTLGEPEVTTGKLMVPILGNATSATVQLVNDGYLPCSLLSAEWMGYWHERARRI